MIYEISKGLRILAGVLRANHIRLGQKCTGRWLESVHIEETPAGLGIFAAHYTPFLVVGRPPSQKFPPYKAIREWIECKGLAAGLSEEEKRSLTWAIMWKIRRQGTTWWKRFLEGKPTLTDLTFTPQNIDAAFADLYKDYDRDVIQIFRTL
jgi:hypothetical protein